MLKNPLLLNKYMKEEIQSIFIEYFGSSPHIKILDFLRILIAQNRERLPWDSKKGIVWLIAYCYNLESKQNNDGGWENSVFSTSWAMQAESALGASWTKNGKNGADYLVTEQAEDGAVSPSSETLANRIWATSYAVAAASEKPWNEIMQSVSKPVTSESTDQNDENDSDGSRTNMSEVSDLQTPAEPVVCPSGNLFSAATGEACTIITSPVICPEGHLFSATTGEACTVIIPIDSTNSLETNINDTTISNNVSANNETNQTNPSAGNISSDEETTTNSPDLERDTDTTTINPNTLAATAINALSEESAPRNIVPIAFGVLSGVIILYLVFRFFVK